MNLEEKIENACNSMLRKGKLPGLIYLSKKSLSVLAEELKPKEIEIKKLENKGPIPPNILKTDTYTCYFIIDNSLPLRKFRVGPMDEKYFEYEKKLKAKILMVPLKKEKGNESSVTEETV
jgi:hypothetical protein